MAKDYNDITLALAAVAQACGLVTDIAYTGAVNDKNYHIMIDSIFALDTPSVTTLYGQLENLNYGLNNLRKILGEASDKATLDMRNYFASIIHLERQFMSNKKLIKTMSEGIKLGQSKRDYFTHYHQNIIAFLADLYKKTIGQLSLKIKITGRPEYLHVQENADKCRALLLAAVRAAVLWHQVGGSRWQIVFSRGKLSDTAAKLLVAED